MKYSVLLWSALITILGFCVEDSSQKLTSRCPQMELPNGRIRPRANGKGLRFNCRSGFTLVGNKFSTCVNGRWSAPAPICVKSNCAPITEPENALVVPTYNGGVIMFVCHPLYERRGPSEIYCNGKTWSSAVPTCTKSTKINAPTSCDFEDPDLCFWEQDPLHDFDWRRHNFNTPSWHIGTGPSYDHTFGQGRNGYYLYIEATGQLTNSTARIMSPLYSSNLTDAGCFSFWYHMFGITIGTLNVYIKVEGETNRTLMFTKSGNQGNHWWQGFFQLPKENNNFQIILEGVRGAGYLSDIAVDDVAILQGNECTQNLSTSTEITSTDSYDQVEIVNEMQSCQGRCTYTNISDPGTGICQCGLDCAENYNCCPDYAAYCVFTNDSVDSTVDDSESTPPIPIVPKITPAATDRVPIPINPKDDIDPYPSKKSKKLPEQNSTKAPPNVGKNTMAPTKQLSVTPSKDGMPPKNPTTRSTVPTVVMITTNADKFDNQIDTNVLTEKAHSTSSRDRSKVTLPGAIAIVAGAIVGVAGTGLVVFLILQKRNTYKHNSGKSALSDDSDVRFLTSDEILDFNLAKPEDMEM